MADRRRADPKRSGTTELLGLAARLETRLASGLIDQPLCAQLRAAIATSSQASRHKNSHLSVKYDESAVRIWNTSLRASREDGVSITRALPLLGAFALALLRAANSCADDRARTRSEVLVRLLRTSLKVVKTCIDASEYDLATDTLQNAADYVAFFTNKAGDEQDAVRWSSADLVTEYWLLRSTLSWRQDRLDLAEMHVAQATDDRTALSPGTRIQIADLAHEIGTDLLKRPDSTDCIVWFEQASRALDQIPHDEVSPDAMDLRLTISRDLARALIRERTEQSCSRAADLISFLESEQGLKLGVLLLKVDLLHSRGPPDPLAYQAIITQMIQTAVLGTTAFKTILHHIRRLHALSSPLARQSLLRFLSSRLYEYDNRSFIEKAVVMYVWIVSTETNDGECVASLQKMLDEIMDAIQSPLGDEATHAMQTLCWKQIEAAVQTQAYPIAELWCRIASHALLANSGDGNKAKVARKLMIVSLHMGSTAAAREAFYQMPQTGRESAASQYLLYRTALCEGDDELVNECLGKLVRSTDANAELLYACAQEAQQHNSRAYALRALSAILQKTDSANLKGIKVATLTRCMVQMLLSEMKDNTGNIDEQLSHICTLLTKMALSSNLSVDEDDTAELRSELEWFAKTSYNIAVSYMSDSDPAQTLAVIDCCLQFSKRLLSSHVAAETDQILARINTCSYIAATACVVLARSDDNTMSSEQYYTTTLKHTTGFTDTAASLNRDSTDSERHSRASKRSQMLRLEIEALFKLKQFEKLDKVVHTCVDNVDDDHLDTLADLIISMHTIMLESRVDQKYFQNIPMVMQDIVNRVWRRDNSDMAKLARWLRCVFRMTSTTSPETAFRVLEQASDIARDNGFVRDSHCYPTAELEWLASTAFNTAVDRSCVADHEGCRVWAEAALNLAKASTETARLYAQMQGLWLRLQDQQRLE